MKKFLVALAASILVLLSTTSVDAGKATPFTYALISASDSIYGSYYPHTCLTEDSYRQWVGSGSLSGTFTTTVTYCGDPLSPGGQALGVYDYVKGAHDLSITYPDGTVVHGDKLCVATPNLWDGTIEPGTYTITFTANSRNATLGVVSGMAWPAWRATYCP